MGPGLTHGLNSVESGSEFVQRPVPEAKVVKAFTICGFENFEDNVYPSYSVKPVTMYCGQDAAAKQLGRGARQKFTRLSSDRMTHLRLPALVGKS